MTVWLVFYYHEHEGNTFHGAYSTEALARQALAKLRAANPHYKRDYDFEECVLDSENLEAP